MLPLRSRIDRSLFAKANRADKRRHRRLQAERLELRLALAAEIEPNNSLATATLIGTATEYHTGSLPSILDIDYFQVPLTQGQQLTANYGQPETFDPELIGGLEILDSAGRLLSQKQLNNAAQAIAPRDGTYYVRTISANEYGAFNGNYTLETSTSAYSGIVEEELNNTPATADAISSGSQFRGELTSAGDLDYYSFSVSGTGTRTVSIDFVSVPEDNPTVIVYLPNGTELARGDAGLGVQLALPATNGNYLFAISSAKSNGTFTGQYVGQMLLTSAAFQIPAAADSFDTATAITLGTSAVPAVGMLTNVDSGRYFYFDVTTQNQSRVSLNSLPQNVLLSVYNDRGTVLNRFGSLIDTSSIDFAFTAGRYYFSLHALTEVGLGPFQVSVSRSSALSPQRDVPLYFIDMTMQQATHLGRAWVAPFAHPQAAGLVQGLFESRYDAWDVDVTQIMPPLGTEHIAAGFGDFGSIGAGGYGSGSYGTRRPSGDSVTDATGSWSTFGYGRTLTLIHEAGHSTGLLHGRSVQNVMGYVNDDEIFPVGSSYLFPWTDSFVPSNYQNNPRDYLDWALQAGRHFIETEPNDTSAAAISLNSYLSEMQLEFQGGISTSTGAGTNPYDLKLANFNSDAWPDLVVANENVDTITVHLGTGVGQFAAGVSYTPGLTNGINWFYNILATGDINQDGRDDVLVAGSSSSNNIAVYLTNADGTLAAPTILSHPNTPYKLVLSDLNNDSLLDLIVGSSASSVSVQLGNGNGTFQTRQTYTTGGNVIRDIIVARIDGDSQVDVLTVNNNNDNVSVLRGNANGTLQAAVTYAVGDGPMSAALVDVTNDGIVDLVTVNWNSNDFSIRAGAGNGTFGPLTIQTGPSNMYSITTGDFDGDARADLVVSTSTGARIFEPNAVGTLTEFLVLQNTTNRAAVVADLNADGRNDLVGSNYLYSRVDIHLSKTNDARNDRVVSYGRIEAATDVDRYSFTAAAGQRFSFDVEAAEFQYPLDAVISLFDAAGNLLAQNDDAIDRDTGITSVDPYLVHTFAAAGTYFVQVASKAYTAGNYRFKMTPGEAWDDDGPRVIGTVPAGATSVDARKQILLFMNDQLDPATLTANNVVVQGNLTGVRPGTLHFDPFESVLVWTANTILPQDTYTVTLVGTAGGITDLKGNLLDGETDGAFAFPEVSGNATAGGNFSFQFIVNTGDTLPATVSATYSRNPYSRGEFNLFFSDELAVANVAAAQLFARGAGADGVFATADDRVLPLDVLQDNVNHLSRILAFTRGIPDPDQYRIEGTVQDSAGFTINISTLVNVAVEVPEASLFTDAGLTQNGLVGSFVNSSLRTYSPQNDWRTTQTIVGTRTDADLNFPLLGTFGTRASVGITGGSSDTNWDQFSAQWDGYIQVPVDGSRLLLRSSNGSRLWIDLNNDGNFATSGSEVVNNFWGNTGSTTGTLSTSLPAGTYPIRVQYEHTTGNEQLYLDWMTPNLAGWENGIGHGPSVIDTSIQPGSSRIAANVNSFDVFFSGAVNPATLTPANFRLRYSPDPRFFNGNDIFLSDSDGLIAWNAVERKATFQTATPFAAGYYMVELNGDAGGIAANNGQLLDGEYLDSFIAGNVLPMQWQDIPSGDGVAGGDYLAAFTVSNFTATVTSTVNVLEDSPAPLLFEFVRTGDVSLASTVSFDVSGTANFGSDYTQSGATVFGATSGTVTFAAGAATATVTINVTDDAVLEPDETVILTITAGSTYFIGATAAATSTILNDEPTEFLALNFVQTSTGVIVNFNRPLNPAPLNLYDIQGNVFGAADLMLVGVTKGTIRGSLVIDPNLLTATFVATSGRLPPDNYTLTLRGDSAGFQDALGEVLDGDANGAAGGDYVRTFAVNGPAANAVTVSTENFARGPLQGVNLPANSSDGIPILLSNAAGVTSAAFELHYDPALLTIVSAAAPLTLVGANVTLDTSVTGVATIQFSSPTALAAGVTRIVNLQATVPSTAPYRNKQVLDLANISLNGGAIPALDDDAVHVAAYFADVTGNGTYSAQDASYIARNAVGIDTGLEEFKLLDPTIIGDITGNGGFSATDTSYVLQAAVGIPVAEIPSPLPTVSLLQGGPDPKLSIPQDLSIPAGGSLVIPVNIDSIVDLTGNGLESADLVIYYDPTVFEVTAASLGRLVAQRGWMISSHINSRAGRIDISLAGMRSLEGKFIGELVQLHATVKSTAPAGATPINLAATSRSRSTQLNEGFLTLIPAPTDAADDSIDGRVTITSQEASAPAPAVRQVNNHLMITGTAGDDLLIVSPTGDRIRVRLNHQLVGTFDMPAGIVIDGLTGRDQIMVVGLQQPTLITFSEPSTAVDDDVIFGLESAFVVDSNSDSTDDLNELTAADLATKDLALIQLLTELTDNAVRTQSSALRIRRR